MNEKVLFEARKITAGFLKDRREELNLTQEQLAEKCGWHQATIARIEASKFFMNTKQLWIICNALDLYFFMESKEKDSDLVVSMKYRFQNGIPPSKN
jgi:transcriptional regulator with XRE-family HTH domain